MSILASRNEIFIAYKNLAAELNTLQQLMFEDEPDMFETDMDRESVEKTWLVCCTRKM